jgi:hypothetical protein
VYTRWHRSNVALSQWIALSNLDNAFGLIGYDAHLVVLLVTFPIALLQLRRESNGHTSSLLGAAFLCPDRLPHPILAHCILVRHGAPNHVTRDHHSGVNGDGQTYGTDCDHLGPARAASRQSSSVGGGCVGVHCAIVTAVGHQCLAP